jgi:tRNA(Ile)-lysidine synthase
MNEAGLESRVVDFIQRHGLISPGEIVVVAVSGGADSVCLLHILAKWQEKLGIRLHAAHLNHQLRGAESEADAEYVSILANSLGIPSTIDKQDVAAVKMERNYSIEEAAREVRYAFLARVARQVGAKRIAVGHTRDDQVETILMHIIRGTGIAGLCGLAPCSPVAYDGQRVSWLAFPLPPGAEPVGAVEEQADKLLVIRPLLDITRQETMSYCQEHQLKPHIDSSNLSLSFFRNRLRLELLPLLRRYNPGIDQALLRLADIAREGHAFIEHQALELWEQIARQENNAVYLNRKRMAGLPIALQRQLLRVAVVRLVGDSRDIEANHIEAARSLLSRPAGKQISLPHGLICQGGYDELVIARVSPVLARETKQARVPPCPFPTLIGEFALDVPGEVVLPGWTVAAEIGTASSSLPDILSQSNLIACFDWHKTGTKLFVRSRRPGDRFQPLGMDMPKKLYEFMVDAKIPRSWRDHIPIVCSPQQIIWVVGWRIDERVKVSEATRQILRLEFIRSE